MQRQFQARRLERRTDEETQFRNGDRSRKIALIGGCTLAFLGLTRRSKPGLAMATLGGLMAYAGAKQQHSGHFDVQTSFAINCSPETAYAYWRNLENLPRFMRHLESVRINADGRSEWIAIGPLQKRIHWTAEIVEERQNEFIAWRSLPGSDFHNSGSVEFDSAPDNRGTIVTVRMYFEPPAGPLGRTVAAILGKDPQFTIREDMRRFKALLEAGEIPTTDGQTHGPRSALVSTIHAVNPERRKPTEFQVAQRMTTERRTS